MSAPPATDTMLPEALRVALRDAQAQVNTLVLGKPQQVRLAFVALLADGHLLIEDLPGLGKTTLAHAMAATLGLGFQRVQFTSDLLPADILGVSVYEAQARQEKAERDRMLEVDEAVLAADPPTSAMAGAPLHRGDDTDTAAAPRQEPRP